MHSHGPIVSLSVAATTLDTCPRFLWLVARRTGAQRPGLRIAVADLAPHLRDHYRRRSAQRNVRAIVERAA